MSFQWCQCLNWTYSKHLQGTSIYANFQCSKTCGKGVRTREVSCRSRTLKGWVILSDSFCQHKPLLAKTRGCRVKKCPPVIEHQWILSSWSQVTNQNLQHIIPDVCGNDTCKILKIGMKVYWLYLLLSAQ